MGANGIYQLMMRLEHLRTTNKPCGWPAFRVSMWRFFSALLNLAMFCIARGTCC